MTTSSIRNPASLWHALFHHARELAEPVGILFTGYALELEPRGWRLTQHGTGAQSFSLRRGAAEYHFRVAGGAGHRRIVVNDRYRMGRRVAVIDGRLDALRFVNSLRGATP